jgi:hypothetical protein
VHPRGLALHPVTASPKIGGYPLTRQGDHTSHSQSLVGDVPPRRLDCRHSMMLLACLIAAPAKTGPEDRVMRITAVCCLGGRPRIPSHRSVLASSSIDSASGPLQDAVRRIHAKAVRATRFEHRALSGARDTNLR